MKEDKWSESIAELLNKKLDSNSIIVETKRKLPYAFEVTSYDGTFQPNDFNIDSFETDILISSSNEEKIIPRVVLEAKIGRVTTHDAITYSNKAAIHKNIHPYLRYGIILGNRKTYPIPGRLYRHGNNFDFMSNFAGFELEKQELDTFMKIIKREIEISFTVEELLYSSRSPNRKKYWQIQKDINFFSYTFENESDR